jgi:hypothetical protein
MKNQFVRHLCLLVAVVIVQGAMLLLNSSNPDESWTRPQRWLHGAWQHEYHQALDLEPGGEGRLVYGDSGAIRHDEKIRYRWTSICQSVPTTPNELVSLGDRLFRFDFESADDDYEPRSFSTTVRASEGRFEFTEEYTGRKIVYTRRLLFERCPFDYPMPLDYYPGSES